VTAGRRRTIPPRQTPPTPPPTTTTDAPVWKAISAVTEAARRWDRVTVGPTPTAGAGRRLGRSPGGCRATGCTMGVRPEGVCATRDAICRRLTADAFRVSEHSSLSLCVLQLNMNMNLFNHNNYSADDYVQLNSCGCRIVRLAKPALKNHPVDKVRKQSGTRA